MAERRWRWWKKTVSGESQRGMVVATARCLVVVRASRCRNCSCRCWRAAVAQTPNTKRGNERLANPQTRLFARPVEERRKKRAVTSSGCCRCSGTITRTVITDSCTPLCRDKLTIFTVIILSRAAAIVSVSPRAIMRRVYASARAEHAVPSEVEGQSSERRLPSH